jgi:N-acetyltransferase
VFRGGLESGGAFAIIDYSEGRIPARSHWGGPVNREIKQLLLDHAFRWAKTVWLHIGEHNKRSRRATEKLGARLSHIEMKGVGAFARPTAFYRIEAETWQRQT